MEKRIGKFELRKMEVGKWKIVLLFFAGMLGCTILSRAADSVTIPTVQTGNARSGVLSFSMEGEGVVACEQEELTFLPAQGKVVSAAQVGTEVEAGDVLAVFDRDALEEKRNLCQTEIRKLELNLEQTKLNGQPSAWNRESDYAQQTVTKAEEALYAAQAQLDQKRTEYQQRISDVAMSETELPEEERQEWESEIAQLEAELNDCQQSLSQNRDALERAKDSDAVTEANNQRQRKLAEFSIELLEIDIEEKREELGKLEELLENDGRVVSPAAGTVTESTVLIGSVTSGSEYFKIGSGNTRMTADLRAESAEGLKEKDSISVTSQDGKREAAGQVAVVRQKSQAQAMQQADASGDTGAQMELVVQLEENEFAIGEKVHYKVKKESKEYQTLIPVSAIREDSQGKFVLILEEKNSILGKEKVAERVAVRILEKNDSEAAVESAFTKEDKIIASSSKSIRAGDRVRVE